MAVVSRPIAGAAVVTLVVAVVLWATNDSSAPVAAAPRKRLAQKEGAPGWDLPAPDPALHFGRSLAPPRDVFTPLVSPQVPIALPRVAVLTPDQLVAVPPKLAGGEAGWIYTGMVEADGVRMALLENKAIKGITYVREGDAWKTARVVGISSPCVVLADAKGVTQTVYRFDPNAPVKPKAGPGSVAGAGPGFAPGGAFSPGGSFTPLSGPIGGSEIVISGASPRSITLSAGEVRMDASERRSSRTP